LTCNIILDYLENTLELVFSILNLFLFALILLAAFRYFDGKNLMDNYKFEIKKAKDIDQRLDDVKGIDEIKEEIENLIKML
jgi:ATP-dependent Zn protease